MVDLKKHIGKKIKELRLSRNMNQETLAEYLNTTKQTISRYENGDRQANQDILFNLSEIFNISIDEFFPKKEVDYLENKLIPIFGNIAAGCLSTVESINDSSIQYVSFPNVFLGKHTNSNDLFAMKVNGESMNKVIENGSYVICKPITIENIKDDDIVVFSHDEEYSLKRYRKNEEKEMLIFSPESFNRNFTDITIPYKTICDLKIYAKVIYYSITLN